MTVPTYVNGDYASSRGIEATLIKRHSHGFSGELNYTYGNATGTASDPNRALATSGAKRNPLTPDLPTVGETVPGYESTIWIGVMAPKGTPKEVVTFLNSSINKVINKPAVKEAWLKQGAIPLVMTPEQFDAYLRKDIEKWANVVKMSGAKVQ